MRLFSALELDNASKQRIFHWKEANLPMLSEHVQVNNYHITLCFFGEVKSSKLERLAMGLDEVHDRLETPVLTIKLDQIQFWPKTGIVWIGPSAWPKQLDRLASGHRNTAASIGAKKTRNSFQPHVSLTRGVESFLNPPEPPHIELHIKNVVLYESSNTGAPSMMYRAVERWPLCTMPAFREQL